MCFLLLVERFLQPSAIKGNGFDLLTQQRPLRVRPCASLRICHGCDLMEVRRAGGLEGWRIGGWGLGVEGF